MKSSDPIGRSAEAVEGWAAFHRWTQTPQGLRFLDAEQEVMDQILAGLFGYHLVQLGNLGDGELARASRTLRRFVLDPLADARSPQGCVSRPEQLAVRSDCIDVVVMPHTLEFCADPHEALREADRVLVPEGHLVLSVFNPMSLWGLRRWLDRRARAPWNGRTLAAGRLKDWLGLLGFETRSVCYYYRVRPFASGKVAGRTVRFLQSASEKMPGLAGGCLLLARKKVSTLTPIRPRWAPRPRLVAARMMEPTLRSSRVRRAG